MRAVENVKEVWGEKSTTGFLTPYLFFKARYLALGVQDLDAEPHPETGLSAPYRSTPAKKGESVQVVTAARRAFAHVLRVVT